MSRHIAVVLVTAVLGATPAFAADQKTGPSLLSPDYAAQIPSAQGDAGMSNGKSEGDRPDKAGAWRFELTPYLWASDLDAKITVGPASGEADADFSDLMDYLNFAASLRFEGWKSNWGFVFDSWYVDLRDERGTDVGNRSIGVEVSTRQAIVDAMVGYRAYHSSVNNISDSTISALSIDIIGGLRYRYLDLGLDFVNLQDRTASEEWLEPVLGARFTYVIDEDWLVSLRGDVSGGEIDLDYAFTWSATMEAAYRVSDLISLKAGYRILDTRVGTTDGVVDKELNARMQGLFLGQCQSNANQSPIG